MAAWSPYAGGYELATALLHGQLRLDRQPPGLTVEEAPGWQRPPGASHCQLALDTLAYRRNGSVCSPSVAPPGHRYEHVQRQQSIVVTYPANSVDPVRLTAHWRAGTVEEHGGNDEIGNHPLVDLQLESQTDLGLSAFECLTRTTVQADQAWVLVGTGAAHEWVELRHWMPPGVRRVVFPRDESAARLTYDGRCPDLDSTLTGPTGVAPLVVWRLAGADASYVEMCHVQDGARLILQPAHHDAADDTLIRGGFGLFGQDLEKGVILRGRLRGVWLPRQRDLEYADRLFRWFLEEPPPLAS